DQEQRAGEEHGAEAAIPPRPPSPRPLAIQQGASLPRHGSSHRPPPRRSTTTAAAASGPGGALSHCSVPPPRHRRRGSRAVRAAAPPEQSRGGVSLAGDAKATLYGALEGVDRGIFGMTSAQRAEIHGLVELLEARNPTPEPTAALQDKVDGCWKLIYSTISILGKKRTQLGLRDFINLGDFLQIIDVKDHYDKSELASARHEADQLDDHRHGSQQPHSPVHLHRRNPDQAGGREARQGQRAREASGHTCRPRRRDGGHLLPWPGDGLHAPARAHRRAPPPRRQQPRPDDNNGGAVGRRARGGV
ncbi:unnamed protein product, partial [Urochloa humidicola]